MRYFYISLVILAIVIVAYLLGSIPFSVIIGKVFYHKDPRTEGSHNAGGTNAGRVLGKKAGVAVIILDALKLIIAVYIPFLLINKISSIGDFFTYESGTELNAFGTGNTLGELAIYLAALACMIGHCYSIFLKFDGGKAVSTYLSTALSTSYMAVIICAPLFFGILKWKKHVSLSSITASSAFTLYAWIIYLIYAFNYTNSTVVTVLNYLMWFGNGPSICIYFPVIMTCGLAILICKHIPNIKRLKAGTESKISWMK